MTHANQALTATANRRSHTDIYLKAKEEVEQSMHNLEK